MGKIGEVVALGGLLALYGGVTMRIVKHDEIKRREYDKLEAKDAAVIVQDFCNAFHDVRLKDTNTGLLYYIPEATRKYCEKIGTENDLSYTETITLYHGTLLKGFYTTKEDRKAKTKRIFEKYHDLIANVRKYGIDDVLDTDIAGILDMFYLDSAPMEIHDIALKLLEEDTKSNK